MKERNITNEEGAKLQVYLEMRSNMKNILKIYQGILSMFEMHLNDAFKYVSNAS